MTALTPTVPGLEEITRLNAEFETAPAPEIIRWAIETYFPRIVVTSSFGASSGAILHMIGRIDNSVPVVFLQTHYHFEETLRLRDDIADRFGLVVENWEARGGRPAFKRQYGTDLLERPSLESIEIPEAAQGKVQTGADLCCWINKVEPLQRALRTRLAYFTSLRRDGGTEVRKRTQILEFYQPPNRTEPLVKINPLANWSKKEMWDYIHEHKIPVHDLFLRGYKSIGCQPCTRAVGDSEDERAGRWQGTKNECGIHTQDKPLNFQI